MPAAFVVLALAGCARPARPPASAPPPPGAAGPCLHLDASRSDLRILVYRAGALAKLGHNHVLLAHDVTGEWCGMHFELTVPVAALEVDPPAARAAEGEDFATVPSAEDIAGTRRHLMGAGQLEADLYPEIHLSGELAPEPGAGVVATRLELRGMASTVDVPVTIAQGPDGRLVAMGGLELAQSTLGLVPYSVALGALRVRDAVSIRFRWVAGTAGPATQSHP